MGTSVINKLRIEGSSAALADPTFRRLSQRQAFDVTKVTKTFTIFPQKEISETNPVYNSPNVSHPNSAPSRKQNYLQRIQEANKGLGLNSFEYPTVYQNDYTPNQNHIHFLLRGKPVNSDLEFETISPLPRKRMGNFKTSTIESYRSRQRVKDLRDCTAENNTYVHGAFINTNNNNQQNMFYLGPDNAPPCNTPSNTKPMRNPTGALPHSAPGMLKGKSADIEPIVTNPTVNRPSKSAVTGLDSSSIDELMEDVVDEFENFGCKPLQHSTSNTYIRRKHATSRTKLRYTDFAKTKQSDIDQLRQCLNVQSNHNSTVDENHQIHRGFRGKPSPNKYYNSSSNKKSLGQVKNNYRFDSIDSYVHFNKIYPQNGVRSKLANITGKQVVPRPDVFSTHCTDTLLLKMMFEMNKAQCSSVKSISKYSDVGVHKDLEEFIVVSSPSISTSLTSINSLSMTKLNNKGNNTANSNKEGEKSSWSLEDNKNIPLQADDTSSICQVSQCQIQNPKKKGTARGQI